MNEEEFILKWSEISRFWQERFEKPADLNAVLYLIGVREVGAALKEYKKEEKMDLMHVAICKILSYSGYYILEGLDHDGWPYFTQVQEIPSIDIFTQERLMKEHIIKYFDAEKILESEESI
ncbi:MAG: hypothetical protein HYZ42_07455 [Bacteroidetes bacterium]|nr:hypothetical protein [Bacteroidota bacterium]